MEEFIIGKNKMIIFFLSLIIISCNIGYNESIPKPIIYKSLSFILENKKYNKRISKEVLIELNDFTENIVPGKIGEFQIKLTKRKDTIPDTVVSIWFYKYSRYISGDIEVEYLILPNKQYVKLLFTKKDNEWVCIDSELWEH